MSRHDHQIAQEQMSNPETDHPEQGIYLYGIGLAEGPAAAPALSERDDLFTIQSDDLVAYVRQVSLDQYSEEAMKKNASDQQWLIDQAREHHAVIAGIHERSTIMPATFGSVYDSVDTVRQALTSRADEISQRLSTICESDEWAVRIYFVAEGALDRVLERDPDLKRLAQQLSDASEGRSYMLRRQVQSRTQAALEQYQDELVDSVFRDFEPHTVIIQPEELKDHGGDSNRGEQISRSSLLVRREDRERFLSEAERIHVEIEHIELEITGPWPPYSFATLPAERD